MFKTPFAGEISAGTIFSWSCWCRNRELPTRIYEESLSRFIGNRMISKISVAIMTSLSLLIWGVLEFRWCFFPSLLSSSNLFEGMEIGRDAMFIDFVMDCLPRLQISFNMIFIMFFLFFLIISLCLEEAFDDFNNVNLRGKWTMSVFGSISPNKQ